MVEETSDSIADEKSKALAAMNEDSGGAGDEESGENFSDAADGCKTREEAESNITKFYVEFLCRAPDTPGLDIWVAQCIKGMTLEEVKNKISSSDEAKGGACDHNEGDSIVDGPEQETDESEATDDTMYRR